MAGRFRTASNPSSTWIEEASYLGASEGAGAVLDEGEGVELEALDGAVTGWFAAVF